jgi:hypothetical protein
MSTATAPMLSRRESLSQPSVAFGKSTSHEDLKFRQTVVVSNRQGREEAFTIGPDGSVWSFFPDAANTPGSGFSLVGLGMPADLLSVGRDSFGCLVVIAVKGLRVRYRVENESTNDDRGAPPLIRWSSIEYAPLPHIEGATNVQRIYTQEDFGGLRVAAIVDVQETDGGKAFAMAYCNWKEVGANVFKIAPSVAKRTV